MLGLMMGFGRGKGRAGAGAGRGRTVGVGTGAGGSGTITLTCTGARQAQPLAEPVVQRPFFPEQPRQNGWLLPVGHDARRSRDATAVTAGSAVGAATAVLADRSTAATRDARKV